MSQMFEFGLGHHHSENVKPSVCITEPGKEGCMGCIRLVWECIGGRNILKWPSLVIVFEITFTQTYWVARHIQLSLYNKGHENVQICTYSIHAEKKESILMENIHFSLNSFRPSV